MDHARRRSRNAGLGVPENRRRAADELPVRVGRRRRGARPLFDDRARSRPDLANERRAGRDQPQCARQSRRLCALPAAAARGAARADRRKPHRAARGPAADGGRRVRLSRLRHGAADGGTARLPSRSDRHSRRGADPPDARRGVRRGEGLRSPSSRRCAPSPASRRRRRLRARDERLAGVVDALDRPLDKAAAGHAPGPLDIPPKSNTAPAEFRAMVQKAKDYILAGDIFQVVLSQRFEAPFTLPPFALYRALRRVNPAPFLYFLDFGGFAIAGLEPRNPGAAARRHGDDPAARRHAAARRDAARGQGAGGRTAGRSEGARRASHAARSRPQRRRPRRRDRHASR